MRGNQFDFNYKTNSGIYGYDVKEKREYKLMDLDASYLSSDMIESFETMSDGKFYDFQTGANEQSAILLIYEKVDPENTKDRITITYGGVFINEEVKKEALNFNRMNKEYQIVFKDYSEGAEDPIEKMNLDIMAGNVPDIIDLSYSSVREYAKKDLLADLSKYIENDTELSKDDFLDNVWDAMLVDDKLYCVASGLYVSSLVGNSEILGDKTSISIDDIYAINRECVEGQTVFGKKNKSELLRELLRLGANGFIDTENNICDFENDSFKDMLSFCDENGKSDEESNTGLKEEVECLKEDKMLLSECTRLTLENIILYNNIWGNNVRFVGYPGKEEGYSYFRLQNAIGIASTSKVKDAAWQFARVFMTKEYQGNTEKNTTPLRKDCFEMMKRAYTATSEYKDELGQYIYPVRGYCEMNDVGINLRPLTEEEMNAYEDLVVNTKRCMDSDSTITNIIIEESDLYFHGKNSVDEAARIIQNRVQTYIDENK